MSGHSAGDHLALIIRTGDFSLNFELPADAVTGTTIVGAMLDMEPILLVPGCEVLFVTAETLRELSRSCTRTGRSAICCRRRARDARMDSPDRGNVKGIAEAEKLRAVSQAGL